MPKIMVDVNADDILMGKRNDSWLNPVASAMWRCTGQKWIVNADTALALEPQPRRRAQLPDDVVSRMVTFNLTGRMEPFTFTMHIPEAASAAKS